MLGQGLLQISLVLFIGFFIYRDGARISPSSKPARAPGGELGHRLLELAGNTVKAVMIGIVGTAAAQALVAWSASDRRRARRAAAGGGHLLPVAGAGGPAADVGRRGVLAVPAGRERLGHLHGAVGRAGGELGG
jgi:hypothetical protein